MGPYFISVILQTFPDVKRTFKQRLVDWVEKKYQMLASSAVQCTEAQMNRKRGIITIKERAKTFS